MPKRELLGHCPACARFVILLFVVPASGRAHAVCARCNARFLLTPGEARNPIRYGYYPIGDPTHVQTA